MANASADRVPRVAEVPFEDAAARAPARLARPHSSWTSGSVSHDRGPLPSTVAVGRLRGREADHPSVYDNAENTGPIIIAVIPLGAATCHHLADLGSVTTADDVAPQSCRNHTATTVYSPEPPGTRPPPSPSWDAGAQIEPSNGADRPVTDTESAAR
jgi:hypothetical protein